MATKEKQGNLSEEIEWNVENEIQLFFAMNGHKPVGKMSKPAFEVIFTILTQIIIVSITI